MIRVPFMCPPDRRSSYAGNAAARPSVLSAQWGNGGILGCSRQAVWTVDAARASYGKYLGDGRGACGP
jgi:hypothetical protein